MFLTCILYLNTVKNNLKKDIYVCYIEQKHFCLNIQEGEKQANSLLASS